MRLLQYRGLDLLFSGYPESHYKSSRVMLILIKMKAHNCSLVKAAFVLMITLFSVSKNCFSQIGTTKINNSSQACDNLNFQVNNLANGDYELTWNNQPEIRNLTTSCSDGGSNSGNAGQGGSSNMLIVPCCLNLDELLLNFDVFDSTTNSWEPCSVIINVLPCGTSPDPDPDPVIPPGTPTCSDFEYDLISIDQGNCSFSWIGGSNMTELNIAYSLNGSIFNQTVNGNSGSLNLPNNTQVAFAYLFEFINQLGEIEELICEVIITTNCLPDPVDPEDCEGQDSDADGICDEVDCNPNDPHVDYKIGDFCDDGNAKTRDDRINANCMCKGEPKICAPTIIQHISILDACNNQFKHVYVSVIPAEFDCETEIHSIRINPILEPNNIKTLNENNNFEGDFLNQISNIDGHIEFYMEAVDDVGNVLMEQTIKQFPREKDAVVVSDHLDKLLGRFSEQDLDLVNYLCGTELSRIEILSFLRDFLNLTDTQICQLLERFKIEQILNEQYMDTQVEEIYCDSLKIFILELRGDTMPEDSCACNLIKTNRSALNLHKDVSYGQPDECNDYPPFTFARNYEFNSTEDDLIISLGRMGAAKSATMVMQYNNGADSPDNFVWESHGGQSEISFRSICVDPLTLSPDITNCESCIKRIELQYGYFSRVNMWGDKRAHISGSAIGMRAEDWALVAVQNGNDFEVLDTAIRVYTIDCEAPDHSITDLITTASDLVDPIGTALDSFNIPNVVDAATQIITFVDSFWTQQFCDQVYVRDSTMLQGTHQFELSPGGYFKVVMSSGAAFSGKTENNGKGFININSDFYLAATVNTLAEEDGTVPEYCECEKIGAYALGSLGPFEPDNINIRDSNPVLDMSSVFEDVPWGETAMRLMTGAYIGSFGPWDPKWEQEGCCNDIYPECLSECAYLSGCDLVGLEGRSNETSSRNESIEVYPNPTIDKLNVKFNNILKDGNYSYHIYNIHGNFIISGNLNNRFEFIDVSHFKSGLYILDIRLDSKSIFQERILKI